MSPASAQEISAIPAQLIVPNGTPVELRLAENISSAHAHIGDPLDFVVVRPVSVEGLTVIPAGTIASGSVTGVRRKRFLGIGGRVALQVDSVELANGERIRLDARMEVKGRSRTKLMAAAMLTSGLIFLPVAPLFLLTRGHDSTVVKSTEITAHIPGAVPILMAGLPRTQEDSLELSAMMNYLPPRVFSGEGREGDMLNLVFVGLKEELQQAFARAGWIQTDKWNPILAWHLMRSGTHDAQLPMARFYLFGRVQDYSYALPDPGAVVTRRHHLRIWKTSYTMLGMPIWVAAATHDVAIEIAKRGRLINHRIDPAVDAERDFIGSDLTNSSSVSQQEYLRPANPVFQAQTASGEAYHSDSRILLLNLHHLGSIDPGAAGTSSAAIRPTTLPAPVSAGAGETHLKLQY
jgi:hypothetical protein